jgi:hypothetical protein
MFDLELYIHDVVFKRMDIALVCEKTRTWKPTWKIVDVRFMIPCMSVCMYVMQVDIVSVEYIEIVVVVYKGKHIVLFIDIHIIFVYTQC